jgi:hypothetical protein
MQQDERHELREKGGKKKYGTHIFTISSLSHHGRPRSLVHASIRLTIIHGIII